MTRARRAAVVTGTALVALACGVALGAGPLAGSNDDDSGQAKPAGKSSGPPSDFLATFAADGGAALAKDRLKSVNTVIITLPGTPDASVDGVVDGVEKAGANVTGMVALQPKLLSTSNRQFAVGVAEQSAKLEAGDESKDYELIGQALAKAYVAAKPKKLNERQLTIGSAFVDAGLIGTTEPPEESADLAVVVAGSHAPAGSSDILNDFVEQLDDAGRGAVVAGPSDASPKGYVPAIRETDMDVSTFDTVDSPAGQRAVALVAIEELAGNSGSYGSDDADDGPYPR